MPDNLFVSSFRPVFADLEQGTITPSAAVQRALDFQELHHLRTPQIYVSTAITSAGYKRDTTLPTADVIRLNNEAAQTLLTALHAGGAPGIHPAELMVPTELGKVPGWKDSHYLIFYFSWLSGLSAEATAWVEGRIADPVLAPTLVIADDRNRPNAERWPHYEQFVNVLLTHLTVAAARRRGRVGDPSTTMLQLIDVQESLGCRAEDLFAEVNNLDLLTLTLAEGLSGPVAEHIKRLSDLKATLGVPRRPAQLVPLVLR